MLAAVSLAALWVSAAALALPTTFDPRTAGLSHVPVVAQRAYTLLESRQPDRRSIAQHQRAVFNKYRRSRSKRDVVHEAPVISESTSIPLHDLYAAEVDVSYWGSVQFGSPAQSVPVNFDSGSSDIFLPVTCESCGSTPRYAANLSSTYRETGSPLALQYNSGAVSGVLASDQVSLGGLSAQQGFLAVSEVSSEFSDLPWSGIVGLGFPSISHIQGKTLTETLGISVYGYRVLSGDRNGSALDVNALDPRRYRGAFQTTPLVSKSYVRIRV